MLFPRPTQLLTGLFVFTRIHVYASTADYFEELRQDALAAKSNICAICNVVCTSHSSPTKMKAFKEDILDEGLTSSEVWDTIIAGLDAVKSDTYEGKPIPESQCNTQCTSIMRGYILTGVRKDLARIQEDIIQVKMGIAPTAQELKYPEFLEEEEAFKSFLEFLKEDKSEFMCNNDCVS